MCVCVCVRVRVRDNERDKGDTSCVMCTNPRNEAHKPHHQGPRGFLLGWGPLSRTRAKCKTLVMNQSRRSTRDA
jgi:hypothetical protein